MLSTTHVTNQAVRAQGSLPSAAGATPETEGFDFMAYLLGLQVSPQSESSPDGASGLSTLIGKASQEGGEDPVLALFQKSQKGGWNPMFPNLAAGEGVSPGQGLAFAKPAEAAGAMSPILLSGKTLPGKQAGESTKNLVTPSDLTTPLVTDKAPVLTPDALAATRLGKVGEKELKVEDRNAADVPQFAPTQGATIGARVIARETTEMAGPSSAPAMTGLHPLPAHAEVELKGKTSARKEQAEDPAALGMTTGQATNGVTSPFTAEAASMTKKAGNETTVPELFNKVESMAHHGGGKMTVTLTPPHLGQVEIQVTTRGKKVEIEMKSQSDLAKSVIESKLGDLKQSLQGHDLHLTKVEVNVGREVTRSFTGNSFSALAGGSQSFQQSQGFANQQAHAGRSFAQAGSPNAMQARAVESHQPLMARTAGRTPGRVDIRI